MRNPHSHDNVVITKEEYERLKRNSFELGCLNVGGVDNWQWHHESLKPFRKKYYPEDEDDASEE